MNAVLKHQEDSKGLPDATMSMAGAFVSGPGKGGAKEVSLAHLNTFFYVGTEVCDLYWVLYLQEILISFSLIFMYAYLISLRYLIS